MPALSKELRVERATLASRMRELTDAAENGVLDSEARTEFDRLHEKQNELKTEIDKVEADEAADLERIARARALDAEMRKAQPLLAGRQDTKPADKKKDDEVLEAAKAEDRAFDRYLRYGIKGLGAEDRAIMQSRMADVTPEMRAQGTNIDTAGGYTVPEGFYNQIQSALLHYGGMRQSRSTKITTDMGNDLPIMTDNDTSNTGAIINENPTSQDEQDVTFGRVTLRAHMYTSKMVRVSLQFLQDSGVNVQQFLSDKLGIRLGRIMNTHFTTGDAVNKPSGVVTGATQGVAGATGQTTTVTADDLIALEHSVDIAYRQQGAEWMMRDATVKAIKQLKDGNGRPLWLPGLAVAAPDSILGYPYIVNNDVATMAASAKSILFGDFAKYFIRDVRGITVLRLDERYAELFQVAFLAFARADGGLVDAGTNPIKYYQNSAS